jgi:hypothetical protein
MLMKGASVGDYFPEGIKFGADLHDFFTEFG